MENATGKTAGAAGNETVWERPRDRTPAGCYQFTEEDMALFLKDGEEAYQKLAVCIVQKLRGFARLVERHGWGVIPPVEYEELVFDFYAVKMRGLIESFRSRAARGEPMTAEDFTGWFVNALKNYTTDRVRKLCKEATVFVSGNRPAGDGEEESATLGDFLAVEAHTALDDLEERERPTAFDVLREAIVRHTAEPMKQWALWAIYALEMTAREISAQIPARFGKVYTESAVWTLKKRFVDSREMAWFMTEIKRIKADYGA